MSKLQAQSKQNEAKFLQHAKFTKIYNMQNKT